MGRLLVVEFSVFILLIVSLKLGVMCESDCIRFLVVFMLLLNKMVMDFLGVLLLVCGVMFCFVLVVVVFGWELLLGILFKEDFFDCFFVCILKLIYFKVI